MGPVCVELKNRWCCPAAQLCEAHLFQTPSYLIVESLSTIFVASARNSFGDLVPVYRLALLRWKSQKVVSVGGCDLEFFTAPVD